MPTSTEEELKQLLEMRALQNLLRRLFEQYLASPDAPKLPEFAQEVGLDRSRFNRFVVQGRAISFNSKDESDVTTIDKITAFAQRVIKDSSLDEETRLLLSRTSEILYTRALTDRHCGIINLPEFALKLAYDLRTTKELILDAETPNWVFARAFGTYAETVQRILELRSEALQQLITRDPSGKDQPSEFAQHLLRELSAENMNQLEARVIAERNDVRSEFNRYARAYEELMESVIQTGLSVASIFEDTLQMSATHHTNIRQGRYQRSSMRTLRTVLRKLLQLAHHRGAIIREPVQELIMSLPADDPLDTRTDQDNDRTAEASESPSSVPSAPAAVKDSAATDQAPRRSSESDALMDEIRAYWLTTISPLFASPQEAGAALSFTPDVLISVLEEQQPPPAREKLREVVRVFRQHRQNALHGSPRRATAADASVSTPAPRTNATPVEALDARTLLGELLLRIHSGELPDTLFRRDSASPSSTEPRQLAVIGDMDAIVDHCIGLLEQTQRLLEQRTRIEPLTHRATKRELLRLLFSLIQTINPEQELLQEVRRSGRYATSFVDLVPTR